MEEKKEKGKKLIFGFYTRRVLAARIITALLLSLGAGFLVYDDDDLRKIKAIHEGHRVAEDVETSNKKQGVFTDPGEDVTADRIGVIIGLFVMFLVYEGGSLFIGRFFRSCYAIVSPPKKNSS